MFSAVRVTSVKGEEEMDVWARVEVKHDTKETPRRVDSNMTTYGGNGTDVGDGYFTSKRRGRTQEI